MSPTTEQLLAAAVASLGGVSRPGQQRMAAAVAKALTERHHLAVQAGTGTGKSLAYLVPAIAYAKSSDQPVVVSTATIALQRQLVERDLPRLAKDLAPLLGREPTFAIRKGRNNYACLQKIASTQALENDHGDQLITVEELSSLGRQVQRLYAWAGETDTGDRDDLEVGVPDLAWRQVSVTARECVGAAQCPFGEECFAEIAKAESAGVDIIVTNHAMLAVDVMTEAHVLGDYSTVIVDEAHELDGRVTAMATTELSVTALLLAARRAGKLGAAGRDTKLEELAQDWEVAMQAAPEGRLTEMSEELRGPIQAVKRQLALVKEQVASAPAGEAAADPERHAERLSLTNHLQDLHDACAAVIDVFTEEDLAKHQDVVWTSLGGRGGVTMHVAPLSVAGMLSSRLFNTKTVVLTSATLTLGGNFNALAATWGLPAGTWEGLDVGTPFDPQTHGILYTPRHLPDPGRDGLPPEVLEEISALIMAAGGRTLGLFSSRRAAEQATEALRATLPFEVFCQGEDNLGTLVEKFAKAENSCLFGTLSLWQGVDVPGRTCSLVIIDKIPFPRPDDPLLQARKEAADAAGRNGFMEVAATHAALLLAQGAGRLLRRIDDKGVVAILDKRIVERRYGSFLLRSLPGFWRTTDRAVVEGSLQRLIAAGT